MISENFERLFLEAKNVRENAHVPYSQFKVGAAFLTENKSIISGCNVENAAYPSGSCAEEQAIGNMVVHGGRIITQIVVVGKSNFSNSLWSLSTKNQRIL